MAISFLRPFHGTAGLSIPDAGEFESPKGRHTEQSYDLNAEALPNLSRSALEIKHLERDNENLSED